MSYSIIDHGAEVSIHVAAHSRRDLFADALMSLMSLMKHDRVNMAERIERSISASALDETELLLSFLSEALRRARVYKEVYTRVVFSYCDDIFLEARLYGAPLEVRDEEIVSVSAYGASVKKLGPDAWEAEFSGNLACDDASARDGEPETGELFVSQY